MDSFGSKTATCYMTDPSSHHGRRPMTNKTAPVFSTAKIWSGVPEALKAKMD